jgi:hypothetical protein
MDEMFPESGSYAFDKELSTRDARPRMPVRTATNDDRMDTIKGVLSNSGIRDEAPSPACRAVYRSNSRSSFRSSSRSSFRSSFCSSTSEGPVGGDAAALVRHRSFRRMSSSTLSATVHDIPGSQALGRLHSSDLGTSRHEGGDASTAGPRTPIGNTLRRRSSIKQISTTEALETMEGSMQRRTLGRMKSMSAGDRQILQRVQSCRNVLS